MKKASLGDATIGKRMGKLVNNMIWFDRIRSKKRIVLVRWKK